MINLKNKRASHVGFILSFIIFVTAVVWFYLLLQPSLEASQNQESILSSIQERVSGEASSNFTSVTLTTSHSGNQECLLFGSFFSTDITNKVFVKDGVGNTLDAYYLGNDLYIERSSDSTVFFKVFESPEFSSVDEFSSQCASTSPSLAEGSGYEIGLLRNDKEVFEKLVLDLISKHESNYTGLRSDLGVPKTNEFELEFVYENNTRVSTGEPNTLGNIFSKNTQLTYIDKEGNKKSGSIIVIIW